MIRIAESELIINKRGAIYHLDCRPEEIANTIITVGDPSRVAVVSKHFDRIEHKNHHREFITHTGYIGNKKISCISTGIGSDNIDIVLNELDALVNIDFETRTIKPTLTQLNIIRIGTAGSLQKHVPVDSFVTSTHGLGLDNLMHYYNMNNNEEERQILQAFNTHTSLGNAVIAPYISMAGGRLIKHFVDGFHQGITVTCPGFYGPQGRVLRLGLSHPQLLNKFSSFTFGNHQIANFEMETSAMYGLGKCLGHHCVSLSAIIANRITQEFSNNAEQTVEKLIKHTVEIISNSTI